MAQTNRYPALQPSRDFRRPAERRFTPANDNKPRPRPKPWIPANDNRPVPKPGQWAVSRPPRVPGYSRWLRLFRLANPWLLAALTAWELYELYRYYQEGGLMPKEWTGYHYCGPDNPIRNQVNDFLGMSITGLSCSARSYSTPHWVEGVNQWYWRGGDCFRLLPNLPCNVMSEPYEAWFYPQAPSYPPFIGPDLPPLPLPEFPSPPIPVSDDPFVEPLRPTPRPRPRPVRPRPGVPPRPRLPEDTVTGPAPQPVGRPAPRPVTVRRPRRGERERKIRIADMPNQRMRRILGWILSAASEGGDFLDSLYDALPDELKNDTDTMAEKFDKVFRNLDKVDFTEAVNNIWRNHVEDRYFGKAFGDMADAFEEFGLELPTLRL